MLLTLMALALSIAPTLDNAVVRAAFGVRGLMSLTMPLSNPATITVLDDAFAFSLDGGAEVSSAALPDPKMTFVNKTYLTYEFAAQSFHVNVAYSLRPSAAFVTKTVSITPTGGVRPGNVTNITLFSGN